MCFGWLSRERKHAASESSYSVKKDTLLFSFYLFLKTREAIKHWNKCSTEIKKKLYLIGTLFSHSLQFCSLVCDKIRWHYVLDRIGKQNEK